MPGRVEHRFRTGAITRPPGLGSLIAGAGKRTSSERFSFGEIRDRPWSRCFAEVLGDEVAQLPIDYVSTVFEGLERLDVLLPAGVRVGA